MTRYSYVYIVQCGAYYKIGVSQDVKARLRKFPQMPPEYRYQLIATAYTNEPFQFEAELHRRYSPFRVEGEWFELDSAQVQEIKDLMYQRDVCTITLRRGQIVLVSRSDYDLLNAHTWSWSDSLGVLRYDKEQYDPIRRRTPQIIMARAIMQAKSDEIVVHADNDPLNNTRGNLKLIKKKQSPTSYYALEVAVGAK